MKEKRKKINKEKLGVDGKPIPVHKSLLRKSSIQKRKEIG